MALGPLITLLWYATKVRSLSGWGFAPWHKDIYTFFFLKHTRTAVCSRFFTWVWSMQLNSYAPWFRWCSAFLSWWSNSPGFPSVSQGGCSLVLWRRACSHAIREHLYNPSCFSGLPRKDNVCFVSVCFSLWLHLSKPFWLSRALGTEMGNKQPKLGKGGGTLILELETQV